MLPTDQIYTRRDDVCEELKRAYLRRSLQFPVISIHFEEPRDCEELLCEFLGMLGRQLREPQIVGPTLIEKKVFDVSEWSPIFGDRFVQVRALTVEEGEVRYVERVVVEGENRRWQTIVRAPGAIIWDHAPGRRFGFSVQGKANLWRLTGLNCPPGVLEREPTLPR